MTGDSKIWHQLADALDDVVELQGAAPLRTKIDNLVSALVRDERSDVLHSLALCTVNDAHPGGIDDIVRLGPR